MDIVRTALMVLSYLSWIFGLVFGVSGIFAGGSTFLMALGLIVLGFIFFGLNKLARRR